MSFKSHLVFVFLIFAASRCFAEDDHEMEEFLKREHSLSKPYQGTVIHPIKCYRSSDSQGQATDVSRIIHVTIKLYLLELLSS